MAVATAPTQQIPPPCRETTTCTDSTTKTSVKHSNTDVVRDHSGRPPSSLTFTTSPRDSIAKEPHPRPRYFVLLAFIALCLSIFLVALDTVLIPTALPTIALSFHIPNAQYAWIGSAYLLANAASVPFWGKLSDIFGRKPIILTADAVFLGGSVLCGASGDAATLIAGRVVQGIGGGGVVVLVHICVSDLFGIRHRSFYMGLLGAVWATASALGPVLGGIFAQYSSWRWCFYLNIPIICLSIITLFASLQLHNPRMPVLPGLASMDWLGASTIIGATVLVLVGLQLGCNTVFASPLVIVLLTFGCILAAMFPITQWHAERTARGPILPLRIFKDISNLSALSVCACDALAFNSVAYFLPIYFQVVLGLSPSLSGIYMLAIAVPLASVSLASGYVIEKTGRFVEVLQAGLFTMTLGIGLLILLGATVDVGKIVALLLVIGLGFGPNFGAPLIALQTRIRAEDIATGTSAFGFVRMISGAIGVVVGQVVFQLLTSKHLNQFIDAGVPQDLARQLADGEALALASMVARLPGAQKAVVQSGLTTALRGTWIFYTGVSALGLLVSFGIKRKKLDREADAGRVNECVEI